MEQILFGRSRDANSASVQQFNSPTGGFYWSSATTCAAPGRIYGEYLSVRLIAAHGWLKDLVVKLDTAPGAGKSIAFNLRQNFDYSILGVTISNAATEGTDADQIEVFPGDTISLSSTPASTPAVGFVRWHVTFVSASNNESMIFTGLRSNTAATCYASLHNNYNYKTSEVENDCRVVCPTSGKFKNLYVRRAFPEGGVCGDSNRYTLRVNGADSGLSVVLPPVDLAANDAVNQVSVAAGDILTISITRVSGATDYQCTIGLCFVADTDGESLILGSSTEGLDLAADAFNLINPGYDDAAWSATYTDRDQPGTTFVLKKLYCLLSAAPGAGASFNLSLAIASAPTALLVAITGAAAVAGNNVANSINVVAGNVLNILEDPAGGPAAADLYWGLVMYIAPPLPPAPSASFNVVPTSGAPPLTCWFTDTSTGVITSWAWDFGDLNTSVQQNPTHVYAAVGTYTCTLTVTGPGGSDVCGYNIVVSTVPVPTPPPSLPAMVQSIPIVNALDARYVNATQATLRGIIVSDMGEYCEVRFKWGIGPNFNQYTPWLAGFRQSIEFSTSLYSLSPGNSYYFQVYLRSKTYTAKSNTIVFSTPSLIIPSWTLFLSYNFFAIGGF